MRSRTRKTLEVFYHPETLREICALREYLLARDRSGSLDGVDRWIRMVAVNRLTGHSPGFFSVYTLPPNQAASAAAQLKINARRKQVPPRRDVRALIVAKTRSLLTDCDAAARGHAAALGEPRGPAHAPRALDAAAQEPIRSASS